MPRKVTGPMRIKGNMYLQAVFGLVCATLFFQLSMSANAGNCSTSSSACLNGGTCVDLNDGFVCKCQIGFTGLYCDSRIPLTEATTTKAASKTTTTTAAATTTTTTAAATTTTAAATTATTTTTTAKQPTKKRPKKKGCPKLPARFPNGKISTFKRGSRIMAIYSCTKGFVIIGGDRMRMCQPSGIWSGRPPICRRRRRTGRPNSCTRPYTISNGYYRRRGLTVNYYCKSGYTLKGQSKKTCIKGYWKPSSTPYCKRTSRCKDPGVPHHGRRFGSTFLAGSRARFLCNEGYELVGEESIKCRSDGSWNNKTPKCTKKDPLRDLKNAANGLRRHFVNKLELLTTDSRARSGLSSGAAGLDLVFVFDSSASVGSINFRKGIEFARTIIEEFGISTSPTGTRVAVVVFSNEARVIFNLKSNRIVDKDIAIITLANLKLEGGGTATRLGLQSVIDSIVPEVRNNSKKALFLITDGKSNKGGSPSKPAKVLRDGYNFEIFAIGVSSQVFEEELRDIASEPYRTHVYLMKNFKSLDTLKELITKQGTNYTECGVAGDTQLRGDPEKLAPVVVGREAKAGAWPWMAAIYVNGSFRCGGALIAKRWVLTVAHCFDFQNKIKPSDVVVRLGEHDRTLEEGSEQNVGVKRIFKHPQARQTSLDYDLALVKLNHKIKLTAYVRTICLPKQKDRTLVRPFKYGVITGWGSTQRTDDHDHSFAAYPVLKQARLPFASSHTCQTNSSIPITPRMRCAGNPSVGKDACKGDSGSPLVIYRPERNWAVIGLSSWGEGCAHNGKYGVYADMLNREYLAWIAKKARVVPTI
ncbi:complement factor B-like [Actinia tenebrosa]|uniref:C3/C5 convertase n=1 Tax=Actinia tenebrosa TaxID=6105 RepID=A0A6P8IGC7_ACTTE|nr:complement factor B-like [Actinia tenebrosa]